MGLQPKYSDLILNLLVALAVSLVVNFSYVLLLIVDQKSDGQPRPAKASVIARGEEGTLRVSPDGHGYIVYENGDSVYVMMQRIYRMNLKDGDRLVANLAAPRRHGAHPVMTELRMRNGEEFDYSTLFNRPSKTTELALQLFYYLVVSFIMLSILTSVRRRYTPGRFVRHCIWCVLAAAALYMVAPVTEWRSGRIMLNCMGDHIFDYMLLLKCSFAVAVSMLYGWVYVLNSKQQAVVMENERLKNENLTTRYNMLVGQINPHFFFNSLNSLAMLVREKHDTITRSKPFHISIRTENGWLVVSNPKVPKLEPEPSTGIGLENLRNRWHLITGRDIEIIDTDKEFVVRMPLHTPLAG